MSNMEKIKDAEPIVGSEIEELAAIPVKKEEGKMKKVGNWVKEHAWIVGSGVALAVGFLAGDVFAALKSGNNEIDENDTIDAEYSIAYDDEDAE